MLNAFILPVQAQKVAPVQLSWLGDKVPGISSGVSWGVPFPEGAVKPGSSFLLENSAGDLIPVQSWPMAYWPDGSLKWAGCSSVLDPTSGSDFLLSSVRKKDAIIPEQKVEVEEKEEVVIINTGRISCKIPRKGNEIISSLKVTTQVSNAEF